METKIHDKLYINGQWVKPSGTGMIDVINSTTEEVMGRIPEGTVGDVNAAAVAAKAAFETWSTTSIEERKRYLQLIADKLTAMKTEIAALIAAEVGMPLAMATAVQAGMPAMVMASYAQLLGEFPFEETIGKALVVKEPVGVVGCITPWNFPLHQVVAKVAPALAAGCTVVLKPSEVAPLTAFVLAEIIDEIGLPEGVFNLVTGYGPVVGEAIASHPDVDMVSFTGSTRAGKRVSELAAQTVKRVSLELGGKSANVILDDANFEKAVKSGVGACYFNSGQTCSALTRMLVPRSRHDEAVEIAKKVAEGFTVGDPLGGKAKLGPLVSATQRERVVGYIKKGIEEGATLVAGGAERPDGLEKGFFVRPTVFANVNNKMTIAQEEIFGPVLSIIPYEDEDDAVRIANDTIYGLAGGVWSGDEERAKRVARRLRTGQVEINGG
ncbi:MAG: aldehyde dehydrogenase family protein, partial [Acidobacteriota bacterium]